MTEEQKLPTLGACRGVRFEILVDDTSNVVINCFKADFENMCLSERKSFVEFQDLLATGKLGELLQNLAEA